MAKKSLLQDRSMTDEDKIRKYIRDQKIKGALSFMLPSKTIPEKASEAYVSNNNNNNIIANEESSGDNNTPWEFEYGKSLIKSPTRNNKVDKYPINNNEKFNEELLRLRDLEKGASLLTAGDAIKSIIEEKFRPMSESYKSPQLTFTPDQSRVNIRQLEGEKDIESSVAASRRAYEEQGVSANSALTSMELDAKEKLRRGISMEEFERTSRNNRVLNEILNKQSLLDAETYNRNIEKIRQENQLSAAKTSAAKASLVNEIGNWIQSDYGLAKLQLALANNEMSDQQRFILGLSNIPGFDEQKYYESNRQNNDRIY